MNKHLITSLLLLLCVSVLSFAQNRAVPDSLKWTDEYLDTVTINHSQGLNNYSTIGFTYGVTSTGMLFNPSHEQTRDIYPGYMKLSFTHYEKMFDYLPYFGYEIGIAYGDEGYHFKRNENTGFLFQFYKEKSESIRMKVIEVPFVAQIHKDTRNTKLYADLGIYGGYRLSIERFGESVDKEYKHKFYDTDIRWDYGFQGGVGFGLVFAPVEFVISAQVRYSLSNIFTPDSTYPEGSGYEDRNKVYYRFAYPLDVMVTAGMYFHLSKRYGKSRQDLKKEAYDIVYGTN